MSQFKALVDPLLTQASSMFVPDGYISEKIFPTIPVATNTGKLAKYGNSHLRIETSYKGGQGAYRRVEPITRSQTTYSVEGHGLEGLVTKEDYRNVQKPYDAEADEVIGLSSQLWQEKESVLATALADTAVLTQNTTLSGTDQLNDYDSSDALTVFQAARLAIKNGCGKAPDTAWMDWRCMNVVRFHPQLLDSLGFKYDRPGGLTDQELAIAMGVKKVLIADVDYNSAAQGQTDSLAAIWGKHIWFGVCPDTAVPRQVSGGYRLQIAGSQPRKVYRYNVNNPPDSVAILVEDEYQFLLSSVTALYVIKSAIA